MICSVLLLLAMASSVFAAPPAQATYCSEDNLLRAFQHTPTPASKYCTTATGQPTFIAATTYPASRLSSACSCFSRFPVEPTATATSKTTTSTTSSTATSTPLCAATQYTVTGVGDFPLNLLLTIDRTRACAGGYLVTNVCGTADTNLVTFDPNAANFEGADNCFLPNVDPKLDQNGIQFSYGGGQSNLSPGLNGPTSYDLISYINNAFSEHDYPQLVFTPNCGVALACQ